MDMGEPAWSAAKPTDRREILREHRATREPRRNPATVSLPRRQRCQRATATAPRVAVGAAAAARGDRDRSRTGRCPNREVTVEGIEPRDVVLYFHAGRDGG